MTIRSSQADALLERVMAIVPALSEQAAESERLRRPTDAAIRLLEETGVFRLLVPHRHGGLELDLDAFLEVGLTLGEADASLAWVACFCIEHNWMLCQFPEKFQERIYSGSSHVLAPAVIRPTGVAQLEPGGFRLSGRWQWGTGVMHASWVIVGGVASAEPGTPPSQANLRFFALPIADVSVDDTWNVDGMAGTGSNDIVIDDAFVPAEQSVAIFDLLEGRAEGARLHTSPLYHTPMIPILVLAASLPVIGQARAVVRGFRERLLTHVRPAPGAVRQAEKPALQARLARATIEIDQAETLMRNVAAEVCALRNRATRLQRARWIATGAHALHQARQVIQDVSEASGASAHFLRHPLQRALRDANVASCHVVFDRDAQLELYGRQLLGMESPGAIL